MGIGYRIKEAAKVKGMTLKEIAAKSGVSYNTIYSITKRDSERVQGTILQRISDVLEISPSDLIGSGGPAFDDVFGLIVEEYPKANFSSTGDKDSVRVSLGITNKDKLLQYFSKLNDEGQQKAIDNVAIIAGNPQYQRTLLSPPPPVAPSDGASGESRGSPS